MDVLIYSGPGVAQDLLKDTLQVFRKLLGESYAVSLIGPKELVNEPWMNSTKLFVLPGGQDSPYFEHLKGEGNRRIKEFVESGGIFIGLCAGAYYSCDSFEFEMGTRLHLSADRPLKFFPGLGRGAAFRGFDYESEDGARAVPVTFEFPQDYPVLKCPVYWDGGGAFIDAHLMSNVTIMATYDEIMDNSGNVASVLCQVGERGGRALLSFVHPEYKANPSFPHLFDKLNSALPETEELLFRWLKHLGLSIDGAFERQHPESSIKLGFLGDDFQSSADEFLNALEEFIIEDQETGLISMVLPSNSGALAFKLIESPSPVTFKSDSFQMDKYFEALNLGILNHGGSNQFGNPLLHAEVTTSTQRVFVENRRLVDALPSGAVFVADRQVSGKGRGANIWVSPLGCLQFSLYLKHPLPDEEFSVVLLQYLTALAVVEAVRTKPGYENLPLHIKWPNDIYAMDPSTKKLTKIGGILVNTLYTKNSCVVIVGVGLNTTNSHPTICLNDLVNQLNKERSNKHGLPSLPHFSQEELLADILSQLQGIYHVFLAEKAGFSPFLKRYYNYWLHSDQIIAIENKNIKAKIIGISPKSGFLEAISNDSEHLKYELQPDGNSFDMMAGLISTKAPYKTL